MEFTQEQKTYAEIVQKAWESPEFKSELTANPVAAIEKLTGRKLNIPAGKTLVVRDQTDESTVYINIPAKQVSDDLELSEEQLETVAGGTITTIIISGPFIPTNQGQGGDRSQN
jgi:hypothetical protein